MLYNSNARWPRPSEREKAERKRYLEARRERYLVELDQFKKSARKERPEKSGLTLKPMADEMKHIIRKLRGAFSQEWTWRVYVVLTIAGLAGVVVLDLSQYNWDLLWDFFKASHWKLGSELLYKYANWLVLLLIFGPLLVAKALDWITENAKT